MSGIAGILYQDGHPAQPETIQAMVDAMPHRGPDGIHTWYEGSIAVGHCMLHTTPESLHDRLPMISRDGNLVLTADARIDNRKELMRVLDLRPSKKRPVTDCDLIMGAYQKWGVDCPHYLLGAFAFGIWDGRKKHIFCARDHMGAKPLFYLRQKSSTAFAFATEIRPFLSAFNVSNLDGTYIRQLLSFTYTDVEATAYTHVKRLPRASTLTCTLSGDVRISTYWCLRLRGPTIRDPEEAAEQLQATFSVAVKRRLRTIDRPTIELSGGLDSSSIMGVAAAGGSNPIAVSILTPGFAASDEENLIRQTSRHWGSDLLEVPVEELSFFHPDANRLQDLEEPYSFGNYFLSTAVYNKVACNGGRVLLDGIDGDTVLDHGMHYISDLALEGNLKRVLNIIAEVKRTNEDKRGKGLFFHYSRVRIQQNALKWNLLAALQDVWTIRKLTGNSGAAVAKSYFSEWWRSRKIPEGLEISGFPEDVAFSRWEHWKSLENPLLYWLIEWKNRVAGLYGLEVRHPFMDKEMHEICLSIDPALKLRDGYNRWIMRKAFERVLLPSVCWRAEKARFSPVVDFLMREKDRPMLTAQLREAKSVEFLAGSDYWRGAQQAYKRISDCKSNPKDYTVVWSFVYANAWHKSREV